MDFVRLVWDTIASKLRFYRKCWRRFGFNSELQICGEPTESKWEVVEEAYDWLLKLIDRGLVRFANWVSGILRGTTNGKIEHHARDSHIDNWKRIRGGLADTYLMAAVRVRYEFSFVHVNEVHRWCKSRSAYGGFDPHQRRHEIAVQVLQEQLWYRAALASDAAMLQNFGGLRIWLNSNYSTGQPVANTDMKRKVLAMLKAVLEKGQEYSRQYGEGWLQPVHLFGAVCNEEHRQLFAATLLMLLGRSHQLQHALATAAPLPPSGRVTAAGVESLTSAKGWVQEELKRRLTEVAPQLSSLMQQWSLWGLRKHDEWLYLAVTPPQSKGFAFTESACPELYNSYISMLFVGLTDNTPVVCSPSPPQSCISPPAPTT
jgi:hypothetical protein